MQFKMEKTNGLNANKSPVTSNTSTKLCETTTKISKTKIFDDFKKVLEKLKTEFDEAYKKKIESTSHLSDFDLMTTLGTGSFGSVILGRMKTTNKYYAIKIMNKAQIIKNKQMDHTMNEKEILQAVKFPFLIHLEYCFKDNTNVYYVLPFIPGGDMFSYLRRVRYLKEKDAKFYAAQILLALEYLHYLDLVYRDLKPENIVIDAPGYLKITDFGFCKVVKTRTYTLCGTPEYLAPEIILSKGYGKYVDYWSFGIFIYEMLAGYTPFFANELMLIYEKITCGKFKFPPSFSQDARNLIKNMLQSDLSKRYGNLKNGIMDIKTHDWFKMIDWQAIYNRKAAAPFVPKISGPEDTTYFDKFDEVQIKESTTDKYAKEFENF